MTSDIAHFRECQMLQEQSAHHGLYGYAIVARHDFIEARLEQGADRIVMLMQEGRCEEALALMSAPLWGADKEASPLIASKPAKV